MIRILTLHWSISVRMSDNEEVSDLGETDLESDSDVEGEQESDNVSSPGAYSDEAISANYRRLGSPIAAPPPPLDLSSLRAEYPVNTGCKYGCSRSFF